MGRVVSVIGVGTDVTERKQAEKFLAKGTSRIRPCAVMGNKGTGGFNRARPKAFTP